MILRIMEEHTETQITAGFTHLAYLGRWRTIWVHILRCLVLTACGRAIFMSA